MIQDLNTISEILEIQDRRALTSHFAQKTKQQLARSAPKDLITTQKTKALIIHNKEAMVRTTQACTLLALLVERASSFASFPAQTTTRTPATSLRESLSDTISEAVDIDAMAAAVQLPDVSSLSIPDVSSLNIPDVSSLNIPDLSSIDASTFQDNPAALAVAGLAALAVVGGAANGGGAGSADAATGGPRRRSAKQAAAIAIPYHAAARLAYDAWCKEHDAKANEAGFLAFQEIYESEAVAQVKAKKLHRDLETFSNEAKKPIPARKITTTPLKKKKAAEPDFFFADPVTN